MLDIDHFKRVNDQCAHAHAHAHAQVIGLSVRSQSLKSFVNRRRLIARYGGEEFLLVKFDCNERELFELPEELRRSVEQLQGLVSPVTISAGCCHARALTNIQTSDGLR